MNTETMNKRCDKCGVVYNTIASPWAEEYHTNFCYGEMREANLRKELDETKGDHHEPNWVLMLLTGMVLGAIGFAIYWSYLP